MRSTATAWPPQVAPATLAERRSMKKTAQPEHAYTGYIPKWMQDQHEPAVLQAEQAQQRRRNAPILGYSGHLRHEEDRVGMTFSRGLEIARQPEPAHAGPLTESNTDASRPTKPSNQATDEDISPSKKRVTFQESKYLDKIHGYNDGDYAVRPGSRSGSGSGYGEFDGASGYGAFAAPPRARGAKEGAMVQGSGSGYGAFDQASGYGDFAAPPPLKGKPGAMSARSGYGAFGQASGYGDFAAPPPRGGTAGAMATGSGYGAFDQASGYGDFAAPPPRRSKDGAMAGGSGYGAFDQASGYGDFAAPPPGKNRGAIAAGSGYGAFDQASGYGDFAAAPGKRAAMSPRSGYGAFDAASGYGDFHAPPQRGHMSARSGYGDFDEASGYGDFAAPPGKGNSKGKMSPRSGYGEFDNASGYGAFQGRPEEDEEEEGDQSPRSEDSQGYGAFGGESGGCGDFMSARSGYGAFDGASGYGAFMAAPSAGHPSPQERHHRNHQHQQPTAPQYQNKTGQKPMIVIKRSDQLDRQYQRALRSVGGAAAVDRLLAAFAATVAQRHHKRTELLQTLKRNFEKHERENHGQMTKAHLKETLLGLSCVFTDDQIMALMSVYDPECRGTVSMDALLTDLSKRVLS